MQRKGQIAKKKSISKYTYQSQHVTQIAFEWCLQCLRKGSKYFRRHVFSIFDSS